MPVPLIVPADLSGGGIALPRYRTLLADELGFYLETSVTAAAAHGEARRVVLADDFRDDELGADLVPGGGGYLYVRTGDLAGTQSRFVDRREAGYQGGRAAAVLARPLAAPLETGTAVCVTSPLPVKRYLAVKGLDDCVNEALARLPAVARLTLTGAEANRIALGEYPFLTDADQILSVSDRSGVNADDAASPGGRPFRIDASGTTRHVVFERAYGTSETVEVALTLPGDRLVYDGASWSYVTDADARPGLLGEAYRAAVPEHWVLAFGMVLALRFLERLALRRRDLERQERLDLVGEIRDRRAQWAATGLHLRLHEFPRPVSWQPSRAIGRTAGGGIVESGPGDPLWGDTAWEGSA